jgi:transcriptional regulator
MYRPSYSVNDNQDLAIKLIQDFLLGILISNAEGKLETNYLPFLATKENNEICLTTHMARSNPQWKTLGSEVLVSFQGPNRYISPTMCQGKNNVPTWNYAAVQICGRPEIVMDPEGIHEILLASVQHFELRNQTSWSYVFHPTVKEKLEAAIVGVRIKATSVAKFKLGQNRNDEDYEAMLEFLKASDRASDQELLQWMWQSHKINKA